MGREIEVKVRAIRPSAFIASSSESREIAYTIQEMLEKHDLDSLVWDQDALELSTTVLEGLDNKVDQYDFGVFVFAPDDTTLIRGLGKSAVRDNVLFELGLFVGRLGRRRTFVMMPRDTTEFHLPTDLLGIVSVVYDAHRDDAHRDDYSIIAALQPTANKIVRAMKRLGVREDRSRRASSTAREPSSHSAIAALTPIEKILVDVRLGPARFMVINDDICQAATDVVVSSDDNHFTARGGVSQAILTKLGPDVRRQLDYFERHQFRQGHIAITTGGDWGRRAIFHAAVIDLEESRYPTAESTREITRSILACAVSMGARSIALPVLGGGYATRNLDSTEAVHIISTEVRDFLTQHQSTSRPLAQVILYIFDRDAIRGLPQDLEAAIPGEQP